MYRFLKQYFLKSARRGQWHTFPGISLETFYIWQSVKRTFAIQEQVDRHMAKNGSVMVYKIDCIKPE